MIKLAKFDTNIKLTKIFVTVAVIRFIIYNLDF